jgi:ligand-binding SRPBCC domain-containing protein
MKYQHIFTVQASLSRVAEFHRQSASLEAITPPGIRVRVHRAPARLNNGDEMDFTLWLGPLPVRWLARIEQVSPAGFVDRQVCGPFKQWIHRHIFVSLDETTTEVRDEIQAELKPHLLWGPVSLSMWLGLFLLFAYRGWKTKRLLESQAG